MDLSIFKKLLINGVELRKLFIGTKFTNKVPLSIDTDKSIYQGCGYINGYRLSSSGSLSAQTGTITTGFIPCKSTDLIRMRGVSWKPMSGGANGYVMFFDSSFNVLGSFNCYMHNDYPSGYASSRRGNVLFIGSNNAEADIHPTEVDGVVTFDNYTFTSDADKVAYFRINGHGIGSNMIVTVNENIVYHQIWSSGYKNWVPYSIASNGSIYNTTGYKNGYRLSSSGAEKALSGSTATGFIPAMRGDVIRMKGATWGTSVSDGYCYIIYYDASFNVLYTVNKYMNDTASNGISNVSNNNIIDKSASSVLTDNNGVTTFNLVTMNTIPYYYIRISATGDGADMIVTINEEIK